MGCAWVKGSFGSHGPWMVCGGTHLCRMAQALRHPGGWFHVCVHCGVDAALAPEPDKGVDDGKVVVVLNAGLSRLQPCRLPVAGLSEIEGGLSGLCQ